MIRSILRGIRTAATLPVYLVGNALMVPILERRLKRETAKVQSLTHERDTLRARGDRQRAAYGDAVDKLERVSVERDRLREQFNEAMDSTVDRQCWTYGAGQQSAVETVAKMLGCEADIEVVGLAIEGLRGVNKDQGQCIKRLGEERDAALAEADRLRHGQDIEGDHVCPNAIRADQAEGVLGEWSAFADAEGDRADEAEAQLEALRSAARGHLSAHLASPEFGGWDDHLMALRDLLCLPARETGAEYREANNSIEKLITLVADGTPPVQDAPPTDRPPPLGSLCRLKSGHSGTVRLWHESNAWAVVSVSMLMHDGPQRGQMRNVGRDEIETWIDRVPPRPPVEGDYPDCALTQQWAEVCERLTQERDHLREERERDTLRLETAIRERDAARAAQEHHWQTTERLRADLKHADEHYQREANELRARHREVLAERDREKASLSLGWEMDRDELRKRLGQVADLEREIANLRVAARVEFRKP